MRTRLAGSGLVAVAAALVALAAASGPWFVSSAGAELLDRELAGPGVPTLLELDTAGQPTTDALRRADETVRARADEEGLPEPVASLMVPAAVPGWSDPLSGGPRVHLLAIEGALGALPPAVEEADGAAVVTEQDAERLGVGAGDRVEVSGTHRSAEVVVGAVVADMPRGDEPDAWRPFGSLIHYSFTPVEDPTYPPPPPPALLLGHGDLMGVLGDLEPASADGAAPGERVSPAWRVPLPDEALSLELARELSEPVETLRSEALDPGSPLAEALRLPVPDGDTRAWPPQVRALLDDAVARAERATAALVGPVGALALAGQALGLLAVVAATAVGGRRRIERARLWAARGVSPVALGARSALTSAPAVLVGAAAGAGAAWALVSWLGPGGPVTTRAAAAGLWPAAIGAGAALLLVGAVVTVAAASAGRAASGAPRRLPPVAEVTAAALAALAFWQLRERGGAVAVSADGSAELDLLGLALPLLVVVAVAGLGARLLRLLLGVSVRRFRRRAPGLHLASRRLGSLTPATTGLVALAAAAVGTVALSATLAESSERTIEEKAGLLVGADVAARLPRPEATREALDLSGVPGESTVVFRAEQALLDDRDEIDVLAVEPSELETVGHRPRGLDEAAFADLLERLEGDGETGALPALLAHPSATAPQGRASMTYEGHELAVEVVGRVDAFPGMAEDRPLLVVGDPGALRSDDPSVAVRLAPAVDPYLWVTGAPDEEVSAALDRAEVDPERVTLASELREDPGLAALDWTLGFLRGQATALGALGLAVLLAGFVARQRQRALPTALAGRMGLRPRSRAVADAVELSCLVGATLALGIGAGLAGARVALGQYDPVPALALPPVLEVPSPWLAGMLGAAVAGGALALVRAARAVTSADIAGLLRRG